jgi:hypothetical protein
VSRLPLVGLIRYLFLAYQYFSIEDFYRVVYCFYGKSSMARG